MVSEYVEHIKYVIQRKYIGELSYLHTVSLFFTFVDRGLTKTSPGWVGAWWIGFLASFATCFALAFPLFTYSRLLPGRLPIGRIPRGIALILR